MTRHLKQHIGPCVLFLAFITIAPSAADWCRARCRLPAGYGAEGDRRRAVRMPGPVRATVEELSAGSGGSWLKGGAWNYELHLDRGGRSSVVAIAPNGDAIPAPSGSPAPEPEVVAEAGG